MEIAKAVNAAQYAAEAFGRAQSSLTTAENLFASKGDRKRVIQAARDAVQNAADARTTAVKRAHDEKVAREKAAAAAAEAKAKATRKPPSKRSNRRKSRSCRLNATLRNKRRHELRSGSRSACQLKAEGSKRERGPRPRQARSRRCAQAEKEKEQLRAQLLEQFNRILPTTDTPRGLKVNMADVLFDFGKFDLKPPAREALAKMSGIVIAHPGLKLAVEGYTDSVGTDTFNLTLSQNRADTVRAYLWIRASTPVTITATGYGKSNPVASNDTADGRQQNRRVEIIISGELIGEKIGGGSSRTATAIIAHWQRQRRSTTDRAADARETFVKANPRSPFVPRLFLEPRTFLHAFSRRPVGQARSKDKPPASPRKRRREQTRHAAATIKITKEMLRDAAAVAGPRVHRPAARQNARWA